MTAQSGNNLDWLSKEDLVDQAIKRFANCSDEILNATQVITIYDAVQPGNEMNLKQVEAALFQVNSSDSCDKKDLMDVLQDLDRRNFLLRDLKWEFEILDCRKSGCISEEMGYFLFSAVHGKELRSVWEKFVSQRSHPGTRISFNEISVILCDIIIQEDTV